MATQLYGIDRMKAAMDAGQMTSPSSVFDATLASIKASKAKPVSVADMTIPHDIDANSLKIGMVMSYRGDKVPFVQATNLMRKGAKTGVYLLPGYKANPATPAGIDWSDIPGSTLDRYTVVKIEQNRKGARGNPLPDMIHIVGSGYDGITFALNPLDVCAKFYSTDARASVSDPVDERVVAHMTEVAKATDWLAQTANDGW